MSAEPQWKTTTATVTASEFHYARLRDIDLENEPFDDKSFYIVQFRYNVGGQEFTGTLELDGPLTPGEQLPISYDPNNPAESSAAAPKVSSGYRVLVWIIGIAVAAVCIYLLDHFGLRSS
jgi:hypothetical protein